MVREKKIKEVKDIVWKYYKKNGRHNLPWRKTKNPYRILVSEVMLQQTQVSRVVSKYTSFLKKFPTLKALADASLREVLIEWQGLGYNRRAKFLHETAQEVLRSGKKSLPKTYGELIRLPGIGDYTARAVCVFAYGEALPMLETNIRTVLIHHCFKNKESITDKELLTVAEKLVPKDTSREWHWALMDYGTYLKEQKIYTHRKSAHYTKQSVFKGSNREVRGAILRELSKVNRSFPKKLLDTLPFEKKKVNEQLSYLEKEKLIKRSRGGAWSLYS